MRLRESGENTGDDYDMAAVTGDAEAADIPHGELLSHFAEAVYARDAGETARTRAAIAEALGEAALADAAATVAAFHGFPRVADATGIPLEDDKAAQTEIIRDEIGIDAFDIAGVGPVAAG